MLLPLLLAFSSWPQNHEPRVPKQATQLDRPFYVGSMLRIIPQEQLAFQPHETATPVLDEAETRLYLGTSDGKLRCRFRDKTSWVYQAAGSILAAPLIDGENVYVGAADGFLVALNRFDGAEKWRSDVHEELTTAPTLADGKLFVMSSEESVTAVDAADGKRLWKFHRDPPGGFTIRGNAQPRAAHDSIFVGFADGNVAAINPADGVARWTRDVSGGGDYTDVDSIEAPADDSRIYVASAKAGVVALDAATGEPAWTAALPGANHVAVSGMRVIAGGRGAVAAFDRGSGALLWKITLPKERFATQPVLMDGVVLVAEDRGKLLALDEETGEARGAFDPGSGFSQAALAKPGIAMLISNGGTLFQLGLLP